MISIVAHSHCQPLNIAAETIMLFMNAGFVKLLTLTMCNLQEVAKGCYC